MNCSSSTILTVRYHVKKRSINLIILLIILIVGILVSPQLVIASSNKLSQASMAVKMTAFEMPAEYNCPLFSNSPYTDMLSSLDKMQENLNNVFPECEGKANTIKLNEVSNELHKKVSEAQELQKNGQTYKLAQTASSIVELTRLLQQSLVTMSSVQTKACYRSTAQFRNVIFSINDTFQSLSPLILDLASSNPALTQTLGPALQIFAGADAISKGLSLIEQIAKDSVQFDMTDKDNRVNTVKNTCQFMKLYNRLMYLRLSRLGQVQSIHNKFQTEIAQMNKKVGIVNASNEKLKLKMSLTTNSPFFVTQNQSINLSTDKSLELFEKLKLSVPTEQNLIQKALAEYDQAKTDFNFPEITQCQLIKTSLKSTTLKDFISTLQDFSEQTGKTSDLKYDLDGIKDYELDLNKAIKDNNRSLCTQLGQDWLHKMDRLFLMAREIMASYEMELIELNGEEFLIKQKKIAKDAEKLKSVEADYKNLKTMLNYAAFESSEVEKRARGLHKYLFAGPDKVVSECLNRDKGNECNLLEGVTGLAKAFYQEYRNQGPVYELLLNNQKYFDESVSKMKKAMNFIKRYEDQFLPDDVKEKAYSLERRVINQFITAREKNAFQMSHLNEKFLVKGTAQYANICGQAKLMVSEYLKATNHMMSTFGMCEMIKNVLNEPEVSKRLKNYCMPISDKEDSKLNQLRFQLAGQFDETSKKAEWEVMYFNRSPKVFVDLLLVRMEALGCYAAD